MGNIKQTTLWNGTKTTSIFLGNMPREWGEHLAKQIGGQSYMDFEIIVAPIGGECAITAQTTYDGTPDKILGMFLYTLAAHIARPETPHGSVGIVLECPDCNHVAAADDVLGCCPECGTPLGDKFTAYHLVPISS